MSAPQALRRLLSPVLALGMIASFLVVAGVAKPAGTAWSNPLTASVVDSASVDVNCPAPVQPAEILPVGDTYNIDDSAHLMWIRDDSTLWDDTLVMIANIDMGSCVWSSPIAQGSVAFSGIFDGNDFEISNLSVAVNTASVDDSKVDVAGFIGYLDGSGQLRDTVFRNALVTFDDTNNFDDSTLNAKTSFAAVAVGSVMGTSATVEGVRVIDSTIRSTMADVRLPPDRVRFSYVGGVIGSSTGGTARGLQTSGNVLDNQNHQAETSSGYTGGIIGEARGNVSGLQSSDDSIFTQAAEWSYGGGLIGYHSNGGVVTESVVTSPRVIVAGTANTRAGGAFGQTSSASVSGIRVSGGLVQSVGGNEEASAGGVTGRSEDGYAIDMHSTGTTVTATGLAVVHAGGVIGVADDDTASQLSSSATVSALHSGTARNSFVFAGGLIGEHTSGILTNSFATGDVTASSDDTAYVAAGGLIGDTLSGNIQRVYATGNATATVTLGWLATAGGLIGVVGSTVENAYSTGTPLATAGGTATATVGGLVGRIFGAGSVESSFWNTTTSGVTRSAGGIGLTTTQVRSGASPIDTWGVVEGWQAQTFAGSPPLATAPFWGQCNVNSGFPFLLWQFAADPCSVVSPSIVISGSRADVRGKPGIIVTGVTQGFGMGAVLRPWVRLPGQTTFTQGAARILVDESGDVTWQRRVGKKVTVYLATPDGETRSKRITIPRSGPQ